MLERMIPLPEAGDYQVRIARKVREQERRNQREQLLARRLRVEVAIETALRRLG